MFDARNPQERVTIAGVRSPPLARIQGAELKRKIDVRRAYAMTGAEAVFRGRDNVHFTLIFELYTEQDWEDWYALKPLLDKDPSRVKPEALDVQHPLLEDVGIGSVLIERVSAPDQTDDGVYTVDVGCLQFRRPRLAIAKVDGSKASPVPRDPVDQEIAELSNQNSRLARELAEP